MIKNFFLAPIKVYQYISRMTPGSCRYYPTCSEYAKWSFETTSPHQALLGSTLRVLRCNQFFEGGIDYPVITYKPPQVSAIAPNLNIFSGTMAIKYWLVPKAGNSYFVIKDYNAYHSSLTA